MAFEDFWPSGGGGGVTMPAMESYGDVGGAAGFGGGGLTDVAQSVTGVGQPDYSSISVGGGTDVMPPTRMPWYTQSEPGGGQGQGGGPGGVLGRVGSTVGDAAKGAWDKYGSLSGLGQLANQLTPIAKLGAMGLGAYNTIAGQQQLAQMTKLARQSAQRQNQIAAEQRQTADPLRKFGTGEIEAVTARQLPPGMEAEIQLWVDAQKQKAAQYFAGAGQGNSSSMFQMNAWIDRQAQAMREQAFSQMAQRGTNASGTAGSIYGGAGQNYYGSGQIAVNQQGGLQNLLTQAQRVLAGMNASG